MKLINANLFISSLLVSACNAGSSAPAEHPAAFAQASPTASSALAAPSSATHDVTRASLAASAASSPDVPVASLSPLQKGHPYAEFRKALLAQGWAPEKDLQCKANVGANAALCKGTPDLMVCRICDEIPELSAYSDEGDAVMHFTHAGQRLTINASGSISDWKVLGSDSRLSVSDWQVTK